MATNLLPLRPAGIRASAAGSHQKPQPHGQKTSSPNWWTPLFGWSSEPDYVDTGKSDLAEGAERRSDLDPVPIRSRFVPGRLTEEKAKKLRMMTKEGAFHDKMYHSAIASRLASDFSGKYDR